MTYPEGFPIEAQAAVEAEKTVGSRVHLGYAAPPKIRLTAKLSEDKIFPWSPLTWPPFLQKSIRRDTGNLRFGRICYGAMCLLSN